MGIRWWRMFKWHDPFRSLFEAASQLAPFAAFGDHHLFESALQQPFAQAFEGMVHTVNEEDTAHLPGILALEEADQFTPVGMGAVEIHAQDTGLHRDTVAEEAHLLRAAQQLIAERAGRAEPHHQHGIGRIVQ